MPARSARPPRTPAPTAAPAVPAVAEPTTPAFAPESAAPESEAPEPAPAAGASAADPAAPAQPYGFKGLKVWQRAMDLAAAVHTLAHALPAADQDVIGADLRRLAAQVPSYVAAGNSLFQRAEYVQYLSAAHGALARLETLLLLAERLGHLPARESAPLVGQVAQVGQLLRALARALQPPAPDGGVPARPSPRRPAPASASA